MLEESENYYIFKNLQNCWKLMYFVITGKLKSHNAKAINQTCTKTWSTLKLSSDIKIEK